MPYDPNIHHRRSIRLTNYDYSCDGFYFVTICAYKKQHLFGIVRDGVMCRNEIGNIIEEEYFALPDKYPYLKLHSHIVMPNHFHCILQLVGAGSARPIGGNSFGQADPAPTCKRHSLGQIIGFFKYATTKRANMKDKQWQRNFYEHVIRNAEKFDYIDNYIRSNPETWGSDSLNTL